MKKFFYIVVILLPLTSFSQCVEIDRFFTGGFHYIAGKAKGFQFEVGSTGSESNVSYYAIVTGFDQKKSNKDSLHPFPEMAFGLKFAYRFVRVENVLNVYVTTAAGVDMVTGFYNANTVKLLTSLGKRFALSIEPSYLPRQKAFLTQAGINIILD